MLYKLYDEENNGIIWEITFCEHKDNFYKVEEFDSFIEPNMDDLSKKAELKGYRSFEIRKITTEIKRFTLE